MFDRQIDCLADPAAGEVRPVHALRPSELEAFLATDPDAAFLRDSGFAAAAGEVRLLPGGAGVGRAVFGLGERSDHHLFGALPGALPAGAWRIVLGAGSGFAMEAAQLGFCLGAYRYGAFKPGKSMASLAAAPGRFADIARAVWLARDLINTPANLLGPSELASAAQLVGDRFQARTEIISGAALCESYPAVAAVGAGSDRAPAVVKLAWQGSTASAGAPLLALCSKGVCFDTGGYDIKPSAGMLRMKKDMGGAAIMLGLAHAIMSADLPVRLMLWLGCVENSISGRAMRPSDVLRTRKGLHVEVGNTDAEGRLVLADLLAEACEQTPALLIDAATLTGAARVALGPDIPAMFCNDDLAAKLMQEAGEAACDPVWRLPLWAGYDSWLQSSVADMNNVATKPMAGAIVAALFLQRFVSNSTPWVHLDTYAWNDATRPGRPEGGEAQCLQSTLRFVSTYLNLRETE